ncbi:MAG: hypothetical protein RL397_720 [Pseudomonadota bacterium]
MGDAANSLTKASWTSGSRLRMTRSSLLGSLSGSASSGDVVPLILLMTRSMSNPNHSTNTSMCVHLGSDTPLIQRRTVSPDTPLDATLILKCMAINDVDGSLPYFALRASRRAVANWSLKFNFFNLGLYIQVIYSFYNLYRYAQVPVRRKTDNSTYFVDWCWLGVNVSAYFPNAVRPWGLIPNDRGHRFGKGPTPPY